VFVDAGFSKAEVHQSTFDGGELCGRGLVLVHFGGTRQKINLFLSSHPRRLHMQQMLRSKDLSEMTRILYAFEL
jgi:hypothetical protein